MNFVAIFALGMLLPLALIAAASGLPRTIVAVTSVLVGSVWTYGALSDRFRVASTRVLLRSAADQPSFWKRNKDAIVVGSLTNIIAALLGYLVGRSQ